MSWSTGSYAKSIVYGVFRYGSSDDNFGCLVFLLKSDIKTLVRTWEAITKAKTWDEFQSMMPVHAYNKMMSFAFTSSARPLGSNVFIKDALRLDEDGCWPADPLYDMPTFLPKSVLEIGFHEANIFSLGNGDPLDEVPIRVPGLPDYLQPSQEDPDYDALTAHLRVHFRVNQEQQVVELLKAEGWRVDRSDYLVRRAGGKRVDDILKLNGT